MFLAESLFQFFEGEENKKEWAKRFKIGRTGLESLCGNREKSLKCVGEHRMQEVGDAGL